uniref:CDP-diacylglycerol--glycerol-3-phosphate 1-phosphatidyltransferase n=1 Tax=Opuntia streptacantha TaxID=393608 RepID=A0A7C9EMW7_OPUST
MPALKLLLRRTLASTAVNPTSILSPPLKNGHRIVTLHGAAPSATAICWSKLASGTCLRLAGTHVMTATKNINEINSNSNNNRKRVYMLSPAAFSSSTSSGPSSSSSSIEERENPARVSASVVDMGHGHESNKVNGNVLPPERNHQNQLRQSLKLLTLPTILTLARVAAIPVFIGTFYVNTWWGTAVTTSIFVGAAITDWLDGYLARKMGLGTTFGAFLDPVADKLMVAAALVLLCSRPPETAILGDAPWLFPVPAIAIIGREITMSAVREWAASQNTQLLQAVAVNNLGKWKTATQMTALTILLATRDSSLGGPGALMTTGVALLYTSAGLAVWSLVVYMRKIWKVLLR